MILSLQSPLRRSAVVSPASSAHFSALSGSSNLPSNQRCATLAYTLPDPTGTSLTLIGENGENPQYILYDAYGDVLESDFSPELTTALAGTGNVTDPATGLVHLGNGRWYNPALGRPLQPNPMGGPPAVPQALNRYAATSLGQPGVAASVSSLSGLGFATSVIKNATGGVLSYAIGETISSGSTATVARIGRISLEANRAALKGAGLTDMFNKTGGGGVGKSTIFESRLVREAGDNLFEVIGDAQGHVIDLGKLEARSTTRWPIKGTFIADDMPTRNLWLSGTIWRSAAWGTAIGIAIETPFFVSNVLPDPYLTTQQKAWQAGITVFGIGGAAITGAAVGAAYGNVPGAVVGFVIGLGYEYILVPMIIRPAIYQFRGIDPYDRARRLAPLN